MASTSVISNMDVAQHLRDFRRLGTAVLSKEKRLVAALLEGGLTETGAKLDLVLFQKQLHSLGNERHRVVGRIRKAGKLGTSIPYDMPNFLTVFYAGPAFVIGMPVELRFASIMKKVAMIWEETIREEKISGITVSLEKSGEEFGRYCLEQSDIRHFVIAGGQKIVDFYNADEIMNKLDTVVIFGPTLPKALILKSVDKNNLPALAKQIVLTAFVNSGQICALEKEILIEAEVYETMKPLFINEIHSLKFGSSNDIVGPILDKPAFKRMEDVLDKIKKLPSNYKILVGGKTDSSKQLVEPTLVEVLGTFDYSLDYFGPMLFIKRVASMDDAIKEIKKDEYHGSHVYVHGNNFEVFSVEGKLKEHISTIRLNANILSESIDWPYGGGVGKYHFIAKHKTPDGRIIREKGKIYLSELLTLPAR